jgi:thioredoxin-like negative regulator of GroEL
MVLERRLPADVAGLPPAQQVEQLRLEAMATKDPATLVALGSLLQVLGDEQSAAFSYRSAVEADPGNVAARVGLAVVPATAARDLDAAAAALRDVAADNPRSQIVRFNQAWLDLYRGRDEAARRALRRTVALGGGTRLGRTAATLLAAMDSVTFRATP